MSRVMLAAVGLMLIMFAGGFAMEKAFVRSGPVYHVNDEEIRPPGGNNDVFDPGEILVPANGDLDDAEYHDTIDIHNETVDGPIMIEHQDYEWFEKNGSIKVISGGRLEGSEVMYVTYSFADPETEQETYIATLGKQVEVGRYLVIALGAAMAVAVMRLMAGG